MRPSEKIAFPVISGLSPLGHLAVGWSTPWRGAQHARNEGIGFARAPSRLATRRSLTHGVRMKFPGIRPALSRGRTECVPPRKSLFPSFPSPSPPGNPRWVWPPGEGRAPHARKEGTGLTEACAG